ncbi:MAG: hypothetical protein CBARDMAM_4757 [uncultured Caballeronia sp.]|nr:MAG: hypothetical protein CBARDMAM_4757 [uncultured Caballeronia sp.]
MRAACGQTAAAGAWQGHRNSRAARLHKFRSDSDGRRKIIGFAPSAIEAMYSYAWTGNVRER